LNVENDLPLGLGLVTRFHTQYFHSL